MKEITQLLDKVSLISQKYDAIAKASGEKFNIFSIMRMERNEVKTHSRFIAELLNPKGRHGQDNLFLKLFLNEVKVTDFETETANVYVEYYVGEVTKTTGGRIDILIKNDNNQVICIENKIYASEQKNQLLRYYNAFSNNENGSNKILFLTLRGNQSDNHKTFEKYQRISYKKDILNWLEICRKEVVTIPILREALTQYIILIKKLTGQNLHQTMSNEMTKLILKNESNFDSYLKLTRHNTNLLYIDIVTNELFPFLNQIVKESNFNIEINKDNFLSKNGWIGFHLDNDQLKNLNLRISFFFFFNAGQVRTFSFGFRKISDKQPTTNEHKLIKREFSVNFGKSKNYAWWLCHSVFK